MAFSVAAAGFQISTFPPMTGTGSITNSVSNGDSILVAAIAAPEKRGSIFSGASLSCTDSQGNTYTKISAASIHCGPTTIAADIGAFLEFWWCDSASALSTSDTYEVDWDGAGATSHTFKGGSCLYRVRDANTTKGVFGIELYGEHNTTDRDADRNTVSPDPSWTFDDAGGAILGFNAITPASFPTFGNGPPHIIGADFNFVSAGGVEATPAIELQSTIRNVPSPGSVGGEHPGTYWSVSGAQTPIGKWKSLVAFAIEAESTGPPPAEAPGVYLNEVKFRASQS